MSESKFMSGPEGDKDKKVEIESGPEREYAGDLDIEMDERDVLYNSGHVDIGVDTLFASTDPSETRDGLEKAVWLNDDDKKKIRSLGRMYYGASDRRDTNRQKMIVEIANKLLKEADKRHFG